MTGAYALNATGFGLGIFQLLQLVVGPVAQWITRLTTDQKIPGSNPGRFAYNFRRFWHLISSHNAYSHPDVHWPTLNSPTWTCWKTAMDLPSECAMEMFWSSFPQNFPCAAACASYIRENHGEYKDTCIFNDFNEENSCWRIRVSIPVPLTC